MIIFSNPDFLFNDLIKEYEDNPGHIYIASFGTYLNIDSNLNDHNDKYPMMARELFNKIDTDKVHIVIGIPRFSPCTPECEDCKIKYNKSLERIKETMRVIGVKDVRYHPALHLKAYITRGSVYTGGMNLGASSWLDLSIKSKDQLLRKELLRQYKLAVNTSKPSIEYFKQ